MDRQQTCPSMFFALGLRFSPVPLSPQSRGREKVGRNHAGVLMTDPEELREKARKLRRNMTFPERKQWYALRNRSLAGIKFRRQEPVLEYIADFLSDEYSLVIELDGDSHIGQYAYDMERQEKLKDAGFRVLRFGNDDILRDLDAVLAAILLACGK